MVRTASARLLAWGHRHLVMRSRIEKLADHLAVFFPEGASVLDVGAGSGEIAAAVMARQPDIVFEGVDVLVRDDTAVPVRQFDGKNIPAKDGQFDLCMLVDVVHHAAEPQALLAEAARVARHGLVIKDHLAANSFDHAVLAITDWVGNRGHDVRLPYNYWPRSKWDLAFEEIGLRRQSEIIRLALYSPPFTHLFDRGLHFVARLEKLGGDHEEPWRSHLGYTEN